MRNDFYVYEHWRPDKGVCFYVGKGRGRRKYLFGKNERNPYHFRIIRKLDALGLSIEVRMVKEGLVEEEAYTLEQERIAYWRSEGIILANLTDGGDGLRSPAQEVREKMKIAHLKRWTDERREKAGEYSKQRWADEEFRRHYAKVRGGRPWTERQRAMIPVGRKGRKMSPEVRQRHFGSGNPFFGKRHSEATKQRLSEINRGKKQDPAMVAQRTAAAVITKLLKKLRAPRGEQNVVRF